MQFKHITAAEVREGELYLLSSAHFLLYFQFLMSSVFIQYWYVQWLQNCEYMWIYEILQKFNAYRWAWSYLSKQGPCTDMGTQRSGLLWRCTNIFAPWGRYLKYLTSLKLSTFWVFLINRDELFALSCCILIRLPRKKHNSGEVLTLKL